MFTIKQLLAVGLVFLTAFADAEDKLPTTKSSKTLKTTKTTKGPKTTTTSASFSLTTLSSATSVVTSSTPSATPGGHLPPNGPLPPGGEYRIGMVVFPGFTPLDVFGPLEALNNVGFRYYLNLSVIAETLDPVKTAGDRAWFRPAVNNTHTQNIVPTHTFETANFPLDLLIIPGGGGTRAPYPYLNKTVEFIQKAAPQSKYVLSVCTGAILAARSGILDGKRATTNKRAWNTVIPNGPLVKWVAVARYVTDGNIWTSSGVSAGTDATIAWISHVYGNATAQFVADGVEWTGEWANADFDPFAAKNNLSPANNTNGA